MLEVAGVVSLVAFSNKRFFRSAKVIPSRQDEWQDEEPDEEHLAKVLFMVHGGHNQRERDDGESHPEDRSMRKRSLVQVKVVQAVADRHHMEPKLGHLQ